MDQHSIRFNKAQSGAPEQFTGFKTVVTRERVLLRSSGLLFTWDELILGRRKSIKSSADIFTSSTNTPDIAREVESIWSNTTTTQVRLAGDSLESLWERPEGSRVEVDDNCNLDRNTVTPLEGEMDEEDMYPNWYDNGRSSSTQYDPIIENGVSSITPRTGLTSNFPPNGGELVEMVTLLDEEWPFERTQLRVKMKEDCRGRELPTITKLNTWGEFVLEDGRRRERGDSAIDDKTMESSFTDHWTSAVDLRSTLPKIFNFDEGFIFDPESTSKLTTGESEGRIVICTTFSQLLWSPADVNLPLITIWNTLPTVTEDAFVVTRITPRGNVEVGAEKGAEDEEKMRDSHESW
jgi:hypothetical protein